jgi:hypothetical protein
MARPENTLNYLGPNTAAVVTRSKLARFCASLTLLTSFFPIWDNFASVWLLPGCVGWFVMLIGLGPLWKGRRWGTYWVFVGSILLLPNLALFGAGIIDLMWRYYPVVHLDLHDMLVPVAFTLNVITEVLLIRQRRRG